MKTEALIARLESKKQSIKNCSDYELAGHTRELVSMVYTILLN